MNFELDARSREIFSKNVDAYVKTGEPVGSRTLARQLNITVSPATIRNVMLDLEAMGLLFAPHTSAGRLPTEAGLRLFVDGILEVGNRTDEERQSIEGQCADAGSTVEGLLSEAIAVLSGLSHCAGLVMAPKTESPLRHIELVFLSAGRGLVAMFTESGVVENRIIEIPAEIPPSALVEASNYLGARLVGRTLSDTDDEIMRELESHRVQLDELATQIVASGLAVWAGDKNSGSLIVKGQANLLEDVNAAADLEHTRSLFEALETKETLLNLLFLADTAEGVQIFIGSDNQLFGLAGCSLIFGPYRNSNQQIVGAIGVIGPTRMNYSRIIRLILLAD